jgi:hypothetical protein
MMGDDLARVLAELLDARAAIHRRHEDPENLISTPQRSVTNNAFQIAGSIPSRRRWSVTLALCGALVV